MILDENYNNLWTLFLKTGDPLVYNLYAKSEKNYKKSKQNAEILSQKDDISFF